MSGRIHLWSCLVMHFVENVFTDSVPLLLFGLSIFSFSFSLGRLVCLQEFIHFYQVIHFIGVRLFVVVFYDLFLIFVSVVASLSFDFFYLCLVFFFFFLMSLAISSVQSLSRVRCFITPWIAACLASLSITNSRSYRFIKFTYFSKKQILVSVIFSICFFKVFISFIPALIFIVSFLLLTLDFVWFVFSSSFMYKVGLFIWSFFFLW